MNQRVVIAMALASDPTLLILDEPTTGLDATVEGEVLDLVNALRAQFGTSLLFISHNLSVIAKMCDRLGVAGFLPGLGAELPGCVFAERCGLMKALHAEERCQQIERAQPALLVELQADEEVAYLFISHDLGVVRYVSDRIAVLYLGRLMELGGAETVFHPPQHPYTEALLSAVPTAEGAERPRIRLKGEIPSAADPPSGCVFHTRCPRKIGAICEQQSRRWKRSSPPTSCAATSRSMS